MDGLSGSFREQATDWRTFAAVTAGGLAYRAGSLGMTAMGSGRVATVPLLMLRAGAGLTAEVSAFEMTHRTLQSVGARSPHLQFVSSGTGGETPPLHPENPNLWRWSGPGGFRQGLLQSAVTFSALRGVGHLAQSENFLAQHLLQDSAMVFGHNATGALGIAPHPTGSLAEQFLHAEATNLQMGAAMAVGRGFAPGIHSLERGLDLASEPIRRSERTTWQLPQDLAPLLALGAGFLFFLSPETAHASVEGISGGGSDTGMLLNLIGLALLGMAYRRSPAESRELRELSTAVRERQAAWENARGAEKERALQELLASVQALPEMHRLPIVEELRDAVLRDLPDEPTAASHAATESSLRFLKALIRRLPQDQAKNSYVMIWDRLHRNNREFWVGLWTMEESRQESFLAIPSDRRGLLIRSWNFLRSLFFQTTWEMRLFFEALRANTVDPEALATPRFRSFNEPSTGKISALNLLRSANSEGRLRALQEVLIHSYLPPHEIADIIAEHLKDPEAVKFDRLWYTLENWSQGRYPSRMDQSLLEKLANTAMSSENPQVRIRFAEFLAGIPTLPLELAHILNRGLADPHPQVFSAILQGLVRQRGLSEVFQMPSLRSRLTRLIEEGVYDWHILKNLEDAEPRGRTDSDVVFSHAQEMLRQDNPNLRWTAVEFLCSRYQFDVEDFVFYASRFSILEDPSPLRDKIARALNSSLRNYRYERSEVEDFWTRMLELFDQMRTPETIMGPLLSHLAPERLWVDPRIWERFGTRARQLLSDPSRARRGIDLIQEMPLYRPEVYQEILDQVIGESRLSLADHRRGAAIILGRIPDPRATRALRPLLRDEDPSVRTRAVEYFPLAGNPEAFFQILPCLNDPIPTVQEAAVLRILDHADVFLQFLLDNPQVLSEYALENLRQNLSMMSPHHRGGMSVMRANWLLGQLPLTEVRPASRGPQVRVEIQEENSPPQEEEAPLPSGRRGRRRRRP